LIAAYSWWYAFLFCFIISFGWIPYATISQNITVDNVERAGTFVFLTSILLIALLVLGVTYLNINTFWMRTCLVALFVAIISNCVLSIRIRTKLLIFAGIL
jgi:uncharacterized membrane protein YiaA